MNFYARLKEDKDYWLRHKEVYKNLIAEQKENKADFTEIREYFKDVEKFALSYWLDESVRLTYSLYTYTSAFMRIKQKSKDSSKEFLLFIEKLEEKFPNLHMFSEESDDSTILLKRYNTKDTPYYLTLKLVYMGDFCRRVATGKTITKTVLRQETVPEMVWECK